ncbi:MAG: tetratricopeptide repeat protein [Xanthomonadales bacterium]|nr:tetratricopeptide repeat protein [Xanthomonadales bacterium]
MTGPEQPGTGSVAERITALRDHLEEHPGIQEIPVLGELATLLFGTRQFEEAAKFFSQAASLSPRSPELLNNLAACYLEMGKYHEVIETAGKALKIDPALGAALANRADAHRKLGQLRRAADDYQQAVNLEPRSPLLLNKAGANLQLLGRFQEARQHFEAALAASPRFSRARLNLGLLGLQTDNDEAARRNIQEAVVDRRLDPHSREIGNTALAILKNHDRLAPHLETALNARDLAPLGEALTQTTETLLFPDRDAISLLEEIAASCKNLEWNEKQLRYAGDTQHLPFLEAAAHCQLDPHAETLKIVLNSLGEGRQLPAHAVQHNLPAMLDACRERAELDMEASFPDQGEAWLSYWHARLMGHDQSAFPGLYKPVPGAQGNGGADRATAPGNVAGTMRQILQRLARNVPAGVPRAVFLLTAIMRVQPFRDGNERLARFIGSWQLQGNGLHPIIVTSQAQQILTQGLSRVRNEKSAQPVLDSLVSAYRNAQQLLNEFNRISTSAL